MVSRQCRHSTGSSNIDAGPGLPQSPSEQMWDPRPQLLVMDCQAGKGLQPEITWGLGFLIKSDPSGGSPWECRTLFTRPLLPIGRNSHERPAAQDAHITPSLGKGNCIRTVPLPSPMPSSLPFYLPMHVFPRRYIITLAHVATLVAHASVSKDAQTYLSALCAHRSAMLTGVHWVHAQMYTLTNLLFWGSPALTALFCDYWMDRKLLCRMSACGERDLGPLASPGLPGMLWH